VQSKAQEKAHSHMHTSHTPRVYERCVWEARMGEECERGA
jgi:hypothetical protein